MGDGALQSVGVGRVGSVTGDVERLQRVDGLMKRERERDRERQRDRDRDRDRKTERGDRKSANEGKILREGVRLMERGRGREGYGECIERDLSAVRVKSRGRF